MSHVSISDDLTILIAEDDNQDRLLIEHALRKSRILNDIRFVIDGEDLMNYLYNRGEYADPAESPRPGLILLDLNMPKKDGREALQEIKSDPNLFSIPVIVLTTSKADEDVARSYLSGANSFISKPVSMDGLVNVMKTLKEYWFQIVRLPQE